MLIQLKIENIALIEIIEITSIFSIFNCINMINLSYKEINFFFKKNKGFEYIKL